MALKTWIIATQLQGIDLKLYGAETLMKSKDKTLCDIKVEEKIANLLYRNGG